MILTVGAVVRADEPVQSPSAEATEPRSGEPSPPSGEATPPPSDEAPVAESAESLAPSAAPSAASLASAPTDADAPAPAEPDVALDDDATYAASARVERPIASTAPIDPTASGTVVNLERRITALESFRNALAEVPGARVLGNGSLGGFQALSIRGADLAQTSVLLDDLPVGGPETGAIDLGAFPLPSLARVEVFRGGAPAWYSNGAIGGLVRLVTRDDDRDHASVNVEGGSFGTYRVTGELAARARRVSLLSSLGVFGSQQDFRYRDQNGTLFDPSDDRTRRWQNADFFQGNGLVHGRADTKIGRFDLVALAYSRDGGVPGAALARTVHSHQTLSQLFGLLSYRREGTFRGERRFRIEARVGTAAKRNRFSDPYGETPAGPGTFTDDVTLSPSGRVALAIDATRFLELTSVTNVIYDRFTAREKNPFVPDQTSTRLTVTSVVEARFHGRLGPVRFELRPSAMIAHSRVDTRWNDAGTPATNDSKSSHPILRIGAVVAPHPALAFSFAAYDGTRFPTVLELFGDRRLVVPSPDLRPESSVGVDGGVTVRTSKGPFCLELEARGFHQRYSDTIVWFQNARNQFVAGNAGDARANGFEAGAKVSLGEYVTVTGQGTALLTHDANGNPLPLRSRGTGYARLEARTGRLGRVISDLAAYADTNFIGRTYLRTPLVVWPSHTWVGVGVRASTLDDALSVAFSVRDLFDVRGSDFLGYPLAGRTFTAQLLYRKDL